MGRPKGSKNVGYFYHEGRGFTARINGVQVLLRDEFNRPIKKKSQVMEAIARVQSEDRRVSEKRLTVRELTYLFLPAISDDVAPSTWLRRAEYLHDFVSGYSAGTRTATEPSELKRIHQGYGDLLCSEVTPAILNEWAAAHKRWGPHGAGFNARRAVLRLLNWGVEQNKITHNPIRGLKFKKHRNRLTYFNNEQEKILLDNASAAMATAIKVCIRTGARPGCEFAALEHRHITFPKEGRMLWTFPAKESKVRKMARKLQITSPEIIAITKAEMAKYPTGKIFRVRSGKPWNPKSISNMFKQLLTRLRSQGIEFDADACFYTCRHTFAKRTLGGYWNNGIPTTLSILAKRMGNTVQVAAMYADWVDEYSEPLWQGS